MLLPRNDRVVKTGRPADQSQRCVNHMYIPRDMENMAIAFRRNVAHSFNVS